MKYCMKCGSPVSDEMEKFCMKCGTELQDGTEFVRNDGGESLELLKTKYSMKWFKFLIYFGLFAGAHINVANGIYYATGFIYSMQNGAVISPEDVYALWGMPLRILDISFGLLFFCLAAFSIITRFRLSRYKKNGPNFLYILYAANAILTLAYCIGVAFITCDTSMFSDASGTSLGISLVGMCVNIYLNHKYFSNRKELFTN